MNAERFTAITARYSSLRVGVAGDFFLDRYLMIDPSKAELSIETGLPVHNVLEVRSRPGAAGTILNNLVALGVGTMYALGYRGDDGEGYELQKALEGQTGVSLEHFLTSKVRRTPVYCKPLLVEEGKPPVELNRLDSKNWTPTPIELQLELADHIIRIGPEVDVLLVLEQVDLPETGVVTPSLNAAVLRVMRERPALVVLADSRQGLRHFPPFAFKMNAAELGRMTGENTIGLAAVKAQASRQADANGQPVFVTLADQGIVGARPGEPAQHVEAYPVHGPIDIVGAGDSVTANLALALAAGATIREAMTLAMAAASIVIHQLGTTGTASVADLSKQLGY